MNWDSRIGLSQNVPVRGCVPDPLPDSGRGLEARQRTACVLLFPRAANARAATNAAPAAHHLPSQRMISDLWYKNAIIYSLDVETYLDSNGDGVGDLEGLVRRLDYLDALGVDTVWLAPFQPSPDLDDGYDIREFYGVD